MKKKQFILTALLALLFSWGAPSESNAQLNKILKKAGKLIAPAKEKPSQSAAKAEESTSVPFEAIASGGTIQNPLARTICDIELVGLYGKSTSLNYGTVTPVFRVKMILNKSTVKIGVGAVAFDQDGNTYKPEYYNISHEYDVTEGVFVKIIPDDGWIFKDVKKTATHFDVMKMGVWAGYQKEGVVTFKNVPIQWDVEIP